MTFLTSASLDRCLQASLPPPWHAVRDCKIYILDLSTDVAPALGIPQCDINDPKVRMIMCGPEAVRECLVMLFAMPAQMCISNAMELQVWPLAEPGELPWSMQHMKAMPHMHFQYAGQYWLTQALRNASGVLTDNIDEACLVWVDTYCYHQVRWSHPCISRSKHSSCVLNCLRSVVVLCSGLSFRELSNYDRVGLRVILTTKAMCLTFMPKPLIMLPALPGFRCTV